MIWVLLILCIVSICFVFYGIMNSRHIYIFVSLVGFFVALGAFCFLLYHTFNVVDTKEPETVTNFSDSLNGVSFALDYDMRSVKKSEGNEVLLSGAVKTQCSSYSVLSIDTNYTVLVCLLQHNRPSTEKSYKNICDFFASDEYLGTLLDTAKSGNFDQYRYRYGTTENDYYIHKDGTLVYCSHPVGMKPISITKHTEDSGMYGDCDFRMVLSNVFKSGIDYDTSLYRINGDQKSFEIGSVMHDSENLKLRVLGVSSKKGYIAVKIAVTNNIPESSANFVTFDTFSLLDSSGNSLAKYYMAGGSKKRDLAMKNAEYGKTTKGYIYFRKSKLKDDNYTLIYNKQYSTGTCEYKFNL